MNCPSGDTAFAFCSTNPRVSTPARTSSTFKSCNPVAAVQRKARLVSTGPGVRSARPTITAPFALTALATETGPDSAPRSCAMPPVQPTACPVTLSLSADQPTIVRPSALMAMAEASLPPSVPISCMLPFDQRKARGSPELASVENPTTIEPSPFTP
jgi:hypothetical protein